MLETLAMPISRRTLSAAARISLIYFLIGAIWIAVSDDVVDAIFGQSSSTLALMQTLKGWLFVIVTASVLYALLHREFAARERSEQKALEHELGFHQLFTNSPLPMCIFNRATQAFIDVNEAACARYGYTRDEFARLKLTDLRPPEDAAQVLQALKESQTGVPAAREARHRTKSGEIFDAEVMFQTLTLDGQPAMLIVAQDLTARKRVEAEQIENERLRMRLAQENELHSIRSGFISMVSHEFRRPLTTIMTSIELLEQYRSRMTDDAAQKHFKRIHVELDEMKELVDDFLTLMHTEVAQADFKPTRIELTELCQKLVEQIRASDQSEHQIVYENQGAPLVVNGDEKLLRQAVGNLLSNAVKYSPKGGEVRLQIVHAQAVEVRVSDQGIGIPAKDQERIFEPFYRASNVGETGGTGLGLAITRQAIERHGGSVKIARSDSSGTEFVISLPQPSAAISKGVGNIEDMVF